MTTFTEEQKRIICAGPRPFLVISGPGTGKTKVSVARVQARLKDDRHLMMALVTYTRDAADELRTRCKNLLEESQYCRLTIGTFHGLAMRRLRDNASLPALLQDGTLQGYIRNAMRSSGWSRGPEAAQKTYDRFSAMWQPDLEPDERAFIDALMTLFERSGATDYAGLIRTCIERFHARTLPVIPVREMIVDEAQDLDDLLFNFAKAHWQRGVTVGLVADDDQSVYAFKYALGIEGLRRFEKETHAERLYLQQHFRCSPEILRPATRLIALNRDRYAKTITTKNPVGGCVEALLYPSRESELKGLIGAVKPDSHVWAVLARTNRDLDSVEARLIREKIPYRRDDENSLWNSPTAGAFRALLESLVAENPGPCLFKALAGLCLLNVSSCSGALTPSEIFSALDRDISREAFTWQLAASLKRLIKDWPKWRKEVDNYPPKYFTMTVTDWLKRVVDPREHKLLESLHKFLQGRRSNTLKKMLDPLAKRPAPKAGSILVLNTMHGAKGLEFEKVWLFALNKADQVPEQIEEERRLIYVSLTRAKRVLIVSCSKPAGPAAAFDEAGLRPQRPPVILRCLMHGEAAKYAEAEDPKPITHLTTRKRRSIDD